MNPENAAAWWSRFVVAGQRIQERSPRVWPLLVELIESAAAPDAIAIEDLHELAEEAMVIALRAPSPVAPSSLAPDEVLTAWRLVDGDALDIQLERVALLDAVSLAEIHGWARMVAAARSDVTIVIPPRPAVAEQLLAEVELAVRDARDAQADGDQGDRNTRDR